MVARTRYPSVKNNRYLLKINFIFDDDVDVNNCLNLITLPISLHTYAAHFEPPSDIIICFMLRVQSFSSAKLKRKNCLIKLIKKQNSLLYFIHYVIFRRSGTKYTLKSSC